MKDSGDSEVFRFCNPVLLSELKGFATSSSEKVRPQILMVCCCYYAQEKVQTHPRYSTYGDFQYRFNLNATINYIYG